MDEDQIAKLGDKMKSVYDDVQAHAEGTADQAGSQLRAAYGSAKDTANEAAGTLGDQFDSFMKEQPLAALLTAAGVGYVLAFLIYRR